MAKGDDRAVVGSSGRPLAGMVLQSGAKNVAKAIGMKSSPSGPKPKDRFSGGGMQFDVDAMTDKSIGAPPDGS